MSGASPAASIPGSRKAAILMVLLGEEVASRLFQHLPRAHVASIAREVADLRRVDPEVAHHVLEEYYLNAIRPREQIGGVAMARRLLQKAAISEEQQAEILRRDEGPGAKFLGPLLEVPPGLLARVLANEHPQTTGLILVSLPPAHAAQVIRALPEAARAEVIIRMSSLKPVRGELLGEIASSLKQGLGAVNTAEPEEPEVDVLARTAAMLTRLRRAEARKLLEGLREAQPEKAADLQSRVFTFESLLLADDRGIQELLREVDAKRVALALKDADETISKKFFANLSERATAMLKDEMEFLGAIRPEDQAAARREITEAALKLEEAGRLTFAETSDEVEGTA